MNREYDFTLTFAIPGSLDQEALESALFEAGCDDAIIGLGRKGRLALNFTRESASAEAAVLSALENVKQAAPQAKLIEAAPDLVGISDMARLLAFSRQNMRKLIQTHSASFPLPLHEGASAIWHLADVLAWIAKYQNRNPDPALLDVANVSMGVNLAKDAERLDQRLHDEVRALV
ncbi:DNA-binding protein [Marinobacter sp. CHS3-4]|uniref:helix-turn-helix transcriptional regulator n=1 Tax=Marinobacter sp. CHS3-4 TaxID=3045174 RepID=UPI0024B5C3A1|nr:DNA-binding protein [Marinobacter sp. CHS3-4]MDI9244538.1 DNA-binding protein [Marinobacter sp. CHS3-4]